jgi:hypothetical protein
VISGEGSIVVRSSDEVAAEIAAAAAARGLGPHVATYAAKRTLIGWNVAFALLFVFVLAVAMGRSADPGWWAVLAMSASATLWAIAGVVASVGTRGVRVAVFAGGVVHRDRRRVLTAAGWSEMSEVRRRRGIGYPNGRKDSVAPIYEVELVDGRVMRIDTWMFRILDASKAADAIRRGIAAHRSMRW